MPVEPHGGRLVDRTLRGPELERRRADFAELAQLEVDVDAAYDAVQIAQGAYSPLEGFHTRAELESVGARSRLLNGLPWTIPIFLAPSASSAGPAIAAAKPGEEIGLVHPPSGMRAVLTLEEKFPWDRDTLAQQVYATTRPEHPNVADLARMGATAVGGRIRLVEGMRRPSDFPELSPAEARAAFAARGWKNVAAYQCRNPPHTAHEYLQRLTLEREDVDGLFIHPVVGRLKKGDYRPEIIVAAYRALVQAYYPESRVMLGALSITMRYAGPRAALFLAIVRKNFGCSHYIVGRDQAGVLNIYDPYASHRIFDEFPIGITPLRYEETFFCRHCGWMATEKSCKHPSTDRQSTSQTAIRKALAEHRPLPVDVIRPEVAQILSGAESVLNE